MYTHHKLLKPAVINPKTVKHQLQKKRDQQKSSYDKHSKPLKPLVINQPVRIQTKAEFNRPCVVKQVGPQPRSYVVTTNNGHDLWRNRKHLLPVPEHVPIQRDNLPNLPETQQEQSVNTAAQPASSSPQVEHQKKSPPATTKQKAQPAARPPVKEVQPPVKTSSGRTSKPKPKYSSDQFVNT